LGRAGGNLAAVLCLLEQAEGRSRIGFQLLIYPATDFAMDTASHRAFAAGHLLTRADQLWFHQQYLRSEADRADWRASPLRAPTLEGLPPAFVLTAEYDPLRDEGIAYADRLRGSGVAVTAWCVPGQIHGFLPMGAVMQVADKALDRLAGALRHANLSG
jgi:acetyl esterase